MRSPKNRVLVAPFAGFLVVAMLMLAALALSACSESTTDVTQGESARIERSDAGGPARVILTARAADRLGIETAPVRTAGASQSAVAEPAGGRLLAVPYSAVLYDEIGDTWVYTMPEPLVFVREALSVAQMQGDSAVFSEGPPVGTLVVTVGAAELLGAELEIGH